MKSRIGIIICAIFSMIGMVACNGDHNENEKLKVIIANDSIDLSHAKSKDSVISAYVNTLGEIQDNLDSLKSKEHILNIASSEDKNANSKNTILADIKAIDKSLIEDNRKIGKLETVLRKMRRKDAGLNKMVTRLNKEIVQKNKEISILQNKLSLADDSLIALTHRFNDSLLEIRKQWGELNSLTTEYNTVYYLTGTIKELNEKGVISKSGGLLGIGRTSELSPEAHTTSFIKSDLTKLQSIPLKGKFSKLITNHPAKSYRISTEGKSNNFIITSPSTFWSESKYLVVQIK